MAALLTTISRLGRPLDHRLLLLVVAALALPRPTAAQVGDSRCYLEGGGSTESFFVSEDVPVGSIIGVLRIHGDAGAAGGISLHLKERDGPVHIHPGTKNLTLTRRLDKEGVDGPSSVFVNVICERRRTSDPGFVIPVNIRVTDANDNAPVFVNSPYVLNISEVTVVGTRVLQGVRALDADQPGPYSTVHYSVLHGPNSDFFVFVNALEGTLVLRRPLDYESLNNFTLTLRAQDQGVPPRHSDTTLTVHVIDADDQNPRFLDERYLATLPDGEDGTRLEVLPQEIMAFDQDVGINAPILYTFDSGSSEYGPFEIGRSTGRVIAKERINRGQLLQPVTLVIRATQFDNPDRYALSTLTVGRRGGGVGIGGGIGGGGHIALQFLQRVFAVAALENAPLHSVLVTLLTNKPPDKMVRFWLEGDPLDREDKSPVFGISPYGDIVLLKALDYEGEHQGYSFLAHASDGISNDTSRVNISILNVNDWDPRFRFPQYEFTVSPTDGIWGADGIVVGLVEAADGDAGDTVYLELQGPSAKMFSITDDGELRLRNMSAMESSMAHLVVVARDSGVPPRLASVPVTIHFPESSPPEVQRGGAVGGQWSPGSAAFLLALVLGSLFALLALLLLLLLVYGGKWKKGAVLSRNHGKDTEKVGGERRSDVDRGKENEKKKANGNRQNHDQGNHAPSVKRVAPAPPPPSPHGHPPLLGPRSMTVSSGSIDGSRPIGWPRGSIPRRVKKLSWEDDLASTGGDQQMSRELTLYF
ncbi:protocadherin beta-9-like [Hetaerina americana]|uniref:protocadherin beta-9-like n=1 Tax=Hetaerina americana TaxID=62018 RepID=UPI003A7F5384